MDNLTKTVLELQKVEKGSYEWDRLYTDVYMSLHNSIDIIVRGFELALRGDLQEGHSVAMQQLMKCVEVFQYNGHEFATFYKKTLRNKLIELSKHFVTRKMKHNTSYEVALDAEVTNDDGTTFPILERIVAKQLEVNESDNSGTITLSQLLDEFAEVNKQQADILEILIQYSADGYKRKDASAAITKYLGAEEYTGYVQKRVSRARKAFQDFAIKRGYDVDTLTKYKRVRVCK